MTLDIEKCYDSVDVRKLKEFLHKTDLLEKEYYLVNTIVLKRKNNVLAPQDPENELKQKQPFKTHFRHKFKKLGIEGTQFPSLLEL